MIQVRLNVIPIYIYLPPLRERVDDIPGLVEHFVRKFSARLNKPFEQFRSDSAAVVI